MEINNNKRGFASDNNSGVHPDILKELATANPGHTIGYGSDPYTEKARELFREKLGGDTEAFFVFTGTAANVLGITGVTRSWNSVIAASTAHLHQDECGAPEKFSGCKVITVDTPDGKLTVDLIKGFMQGFGLSIILNREWFLFRSRLRWEQSIPPGRSGRLLITFTD